MLPPKSRRASVQLALLTLLLLQLHSTQAAASNSLANCQAVATQFATTVASTQASITASVGINVTCATLAVCPGVNSSGVCTWQRKLSVVCRNASGVIKIRVQSNGLPGRCASVPISPFTEQNIDFEVNFNPDVSVSSPNQNPQTQSALNTVVCDVNGQSSVPSASGFVLYGGNMNTVSGVSIDGVMILNVNSAANVDPFYPSSGSAEMVDSCLAHCQMSGMYHYHMASGCAVNPSLGSTSACAQVPSCASNIATYGLGLFSAYRTLTVIGIAKDGHVIYGPYLSGAIQVTSGFDICNGMFYDAIGNYAYFATTTYPYITGCFGPGNYPSFRPTCSNNTATAYTMSTYAVALNSSATTVSTSSTVSVASGNTTMAITSTGNNMITTTSASQTTKTLTGSLIVFCLLFLLIVV